MGYRKPLPVPSLGLWPARIFSGDLHGWPDRPHRKRTYAQPGLPSLQALFRCVPVPRLAGIGRRFWLLWRRRGCWFWLWFWLRLLLWRWLRPPRDHRGRQCRILPDGRDNLGHQLERESSLELVVLLNKLDRPSQRGALRFVVIWISVVVANPLCEKIAAAAQHVQLLAD
jgi:hypothetical protein